MSVRNERPHSPSWWDSPRALVLGSLALAALLAAAYANSFHVPFVFDDVESITENPTIRSLATAWLPPAASGITVSGRPLLNLSLAINYALGGTAVEGYHVVNLLLHALSTFILWRLLHRTLQQPALATRFGPRTGLLSWFIAALWALHPLQTSAVTYVIQRAEILVGLFYLLTLYAFIRSVQTRSRRWIAVTWLACLAGMASKEVMASAPLIVLLYDRTFVSGTFAESWRRRRTLHLSLAATWLMLLACVLQSGGRGASVGFTQITWWEYALTQANALTRYLFLAVWPATQIFDYGPVVMLYPSVLIPCGLLVASLLAFTVFGLRRFPIAGFAGAWFFLILAPTSSVVPVITQTIAEHRMYLPLAGLVTAAVLFLFQKAPPRLAVALSVLFLASAGIRTHVRNHDYRTVRSLWRHTADHFPKNPRALYNLGVIHSEAGEFAASIPLFNVALALAPAYSNAQHNLGFALLSLNRTSEAIPALEKAVNLAPQNDAFHASLGDAFLASGQLEKALGAYRLALKLAPGLTAYDVAVAKTLVALQRHDEAMLHYQAALLADPDHDDASTGYATLLLARDRPAEAAAILRKSLSRHPDSSRLRSNLGIALAKSGRTEEGLHELGQALRLDPGNDEIRYTLAALLVSTDRFAEAIPQYEALLKRSQPTADLFDMLGMLYGRTGRFREAHTAFQQALGLDSTHVNARRNLTQIETLMKTRSSP